jgi:hypothetical protein
MWSRLGLALRLCWQLNVRYRSARESLRDRYGAEWIARNLPELKRPFLWAPCQKILAGVVPTRDDPRLVAERQWLRELLRTLEGLPNRRTNPVRTRYGKRVQQAVIARCFRAICESQLDPVILDKLPPISNLTSFLADWLRQAGADRGIATRGRLARSFGTFCVMYAIPGKVLPRGHQEELAATARKLDTEYQASVEAAARQRIIHEFELQSLRYLAIPTAWEAANAEFVENR